jgi:hypothetical protein
VSEDEGLRNEILGKTRILHILYILEVPRCTRMRRGQNWSLVPTFRQVCYRGLLDCRLMKHFMDISVSHPCNGTMLERERWGLK